MAENWWTDGRERVDNRALVDGWQRNWMTVSAAHKKLGSSLKTLPPCVRNERRHGTTRMLPGGVARKKPRKSISMLDT